MAPVHRRIQIVLPYNVGICGGHGGGEGGGSGGRGRGMRGEGEGEGNEASG